MSTKTERVHKKNKFHKERNKRWTNGEREDMSFYVMLQQSTK